MKSLVDHMAAKTLVTGSSALRIAMAKTVWQGRISMLELGPLRLGEIAGVRQLGDLPPFQPTAQVEAWTRQEFWPDLTSYAKSTPGFSRKRSRRFPTLAAIPSVTSREPNDPSWRTRSPGWSLNVRWCTTCGPDRMAADGTEGPRRDISTGLPLRRAECSRTIYQGRGRAGAGTRRP